MGNKMNKLKAMYFTLAATALTAPAVFAEPVAVDYSSVTAGINFEGIVTGVLGVAAALAAVYAGIKGAQLLLSFLRR